MCKIRIDKRKTTYDVKKEGKKHSIICICVPYAPVGVASIVLAWMIYI